MKAYDRDLTDYHWLAWPEYGNQKPYEWPAILWDPRRLRPLDSGGFWLSETPDVHSRSWNTDNIRSCQWIRFRDLASGAEFVHTNTHLDHRSELARIEGSRLIIRRLDAEHPDATIIATGDYNDVPGSATYRTWLDAGFSDAHVDGRVQRRRRASPTPTTAGAAIPSRATMTRRSASTGSCCAAACVRSSCEIVRDGGPVVWPSDHFPVIAELALIRSSAVTDSPTWEREAEHWTAWARTPGHDVFPYFSPAFFDEILPAPTGLTLEVGCGEGRVVRAMSERGHRVVGLDGSPTLARNAAASIGASAYIAGDATALAVR